MSSRLIGGPFRAVKEGRQYGGDYPPGIHAVTWNGVLSVLRAQRGTWFSVRQVAAVLGGNNLDVGALLRIMAKAGEIVVIKEQLCNFYRAEGKNDQL